jgi:hypothetical protein
MKTTYLKNKLLEHLTGKTTYTKPSATYLGLLTADPTVDGVQTSEVSGGSYARQAVTWATAALGIIKNNGAVNYSTMPATKIKYWGVFDAATAGNLLEYYPFETPIIVTASQNLTISSGNLMLREE